MSIDCSLRSLTSPASSDMLQSHNSLTFRLLKTVADFSQALATLHDRFGHELQMLVETFRKRNGELRKERLNCPNGLFQIWELFLQQVEVNSQEHGDIGRDLGQQIGQGLIERVFHRKIQSKKIFAHRERIEAILIKSNELLHKCYKDYCQAYALALTDPAQFMTEYIASHNVYVHQLQATNGMVHAYQTKALPRLLEELEECHLETSSSISSSLLSSSELIAEKSKEQASGYENLAGACKQANHRQDLAQFVKVAASACATISIQSSRQGLDGSSLSSPNGAELDKGATGGSGANNEQQDRLAAIRYHQFQAANLALIEQSNLNQIDSKNMQLVPTFKNEIAPDLSQPPGQQQPHLEKDRQNLEERIDRFEERIEQLSRLLNRSSESRLHNKVNELQEELSQRRFDLYVAQIHLSAVRSQLQLFEYNFRPTNFAAEFQDQLAPTGATCSGPDQLGVGVAQAAATGGVGASGSRQSPTMAAAANTGYRHKWIKALKSLKDSPTAPSPANSSSSTGNSNNNNNTPLACQNAVQMSQKLNEATSDLVSIATDQSLASSSTNEYHHARDSQTLENQHCFQEYTFKKIASCDVCKDFLRGHMRQGVKCKLCKISCHNDCQSKAHATIKCQQPKIKLLRRQKSAGELEVNHSDHGDASDQGERTTTAPAGASSKPESIYALIRQVLDAKKRGGSGSSHAQQQQQQAQFDHHGQQQQQHYLLRPSGVQAPLSGSLMINLSTGNLALANQNGKSVSTSALGRPEASVDRWSVVMDLLAQSKLKDGGGGGGAAGDTDPVSGASGKRHSKQLDKFKLAARSAAIASKHQRQHQADNTTAGLGSGLGGGLANSQQPPTQGTNNAEQAAKKPQPMQQAGGFLGQPSSQQQQQQQQQLPRGQKDSSQQQQQQQQHIATSNLALVHHTKSLPIGGKLAPGATNQAPSKQYDASNLQQPQQLGPNAEQLAVGPTNGQAAGEMMHLQQQQQQQHQGAANYQLLNIIGAQQQQQLQSTSAPHSPQRKRFNLRMKSFSLDSPETPVIGYVTSATSSSGTQANLHQHQQDSTNANQVPASMDQKQQHERDQPFQGQPQQQDLQAYYYIRQQQQQQQHPLISAYGQPQPHLQQQQQQQQQQPQHEAYDMRHGGYLSTSISQRHSGSGPSAHQQAQHRHSYHHNPLTSTYNYQQAPDLMGLGGQMQQFQQMQQHSSSQLNLSSQSQAPVSSSELGGGGGAGSGPNKQNNVTNDNSGERQQQSDQTSAYYDNLNRVVGNTNPSQQLQQLQQQLHPTGDPTNTFVVLYDYVAQRADEVQLSAGQLVHVLDTTERDWWKVCPLDGAMPNGCQLIGYFPSTYLARLYQNERPLQVAQTIQVSNGENCDKLLRGQIVIHTGEQLNNGIVTVRTVTFAPTNQTQVGGLVEPVNHEISHYVQCPDKYLIELLDNAH